MTIYLHCNLFHNVDKEKETVGNGRSAKGTGGCEGCAAKMTEGLSMAETEKKKRPQRNALRSQKLIKKAFAKLLHEKELNKITVSDIVKEAEICRGTFYAHFIDINDLFEQMEKETIDYVMKFIEDMGVVNFFENPRPVLELLMAGIEKDKEYYKNLLLNKSALVISERLINTLRDRFVDEITAGFPAKSKDETRAFLIYVANGIEGLFVRWLNDKAPLPTKGIIDMMCLMIGGCLDAFVRSEQ